MLKRLADSLSTQSFPYFSVLSVECVFGLVWIQRERIVTGRNKLVFIAFLDFLFILFPFFWPVNFRVFFHYIRCSSGLFSFCLVFILFLDFEKFIDCKNFI